jgi:site-specific recombinase XerD
MSTTTELTTDDAWELYASNRRANPNYSDGTVRTYRSGVDKFTEWLHENNLRFSDLDDLEPYEVGQFTVWLEDNHDYEPNTVASYTKGVSQLLQYCEDNDMIGESVVKGHETRSAKKEERQWDKEIDIDRTEKIASYLQRHHPGHRDTTIFTVLLRTGMRKSGLRAIDVGDIRESDSGGWVIDLRDRGDTSLKEGVDHERLINIQQPTREVIEEYVQNHRIDVTDNGRKPLITTRFGRVSKTTISTSVKKATCPTRTGVGECSCEPPVSKEKARDCDESHSPHALRAAHITHLLNNGWTYEFVGKRVACQPDTLRLHYDRADKEQEAERRRSLLDEL